MSGELDQILWIGVKIICVNENVLFTKSCSPNHRAGIGNRGLLLVNMMNTCGGPAKSNYCRNELVTCFVYEKMRAPSARGVKHPGVLFQIWNGFRISVWNLQTQKNPKKVLFSLISVYVEPVVPGTHLFAHPTHWRTTWTGTRGYPDAGSLILCGFEIDNLFSFAETSCCIDILL